MPGCSFCGNNFQNRYTGRDGIEGNCEFCGPFFISRSYLPAIIEEENTHFVASWLYENKNNFSEQIEFNSNHPIDDLLEIGKNLTLLERANKLIYEINKRTDTYGRKFEPGEPWIKIASYSKDTNEANRILNILKERGLAAATDTSGRFRLTTNGLEYCDKHDKKAKGKTVFVAMPFSNIPSEIANYYLEAIQPAILDNGLEALNVGRVEHNDKIDDFIIKSINQARIVVADLTLHNPNVYFEAGYALARNIPVIWSCYDTYFSGLKFDIRQYNCIRWSTYEELRTKLTTRLAATIEE